MAPQLPPEMQQHPTGLQQPVLGHAMVAPMDRLPPKPTGAQVCVVLKIFD